MRKLVLTVHVIASVAWIGGSACLLVLGLTGLLADDPQVQRAAYIADGALGAWVARPVSILALVSGVLISVGTKWGLFRYWWVLISLVATAAMTAAVTFQLAPRLIRAGESALAAPPGADVVAAVGPDAASLVVAPSVALVALSIVTALNVYKPWGRVRRS
ncbi:hypothetical protein GCM10011581_32170 [Saccharopolyspora subtropica]|uniref:DUF2269 family protein n=1 Tax=Saccharopolyspora thermophila TaxID=89367 RepID=A0A917K1D3_9PSEU|nr:hypothetical protein [Saccharopolyspora subtropica]GGI92558.1 hypothetical protein GCM10011581_32170 [Saccharopolyspora subtropica]